MNRVRFQRRALRDLLRIDSHGDFHDALFRHAIDRYRAHVEGHAARQSPSASPQGAQWSQRQRSAGVEVGPGADFALSSSEGERSQRTSLGRVLAIGANHREARALAKLPFEQILLTGIADPDDAIRSALDGDPRISYRIENSEKLALESRSFDLVFCKESLHHLARPVLGLYEMLRICRRAALVIEPYDTVAGRLFERLGLATVYETHQVDNLGARDNFVYRFGRRPLETLLNSYYLESDYTLEITLGWMSSRWNAHPVAGVRRLAALAGWGLGFVPGSRGNYMTALILPGRDLPADPVVTDEKPADSP